MLNSDEPERKRRKRLRLPGFDYAAAAPYFVTICTDHRQCILSLVENDSVVLTELGTLIHDEWLTIPDRHRGVALDALMSAIVEAFKSRCLVAAIRRDLLGGRALWQRGFYDHAIRNEEALNRIRGYIEMNPSKWHLDTENPACRQVNRAVAAGSGGRPQGPPLR